MKKPLGETTKQKNLKDIILNKDLLIVQLKSHACKYLIEL